MQTRVLGLSLQAGLCRGSALQAACSTGLRLLQGSHLSQSITTCNGTASPAEPAVSMQTATDCYGNSTLQIGSWGEVSSIPLNDPAPQLRAAAEQGIYLNQDGCR